MDDQENLNVFSLNFSPLGRYSSTQTTAGFILWERSANPLSMRAEFEVLITDIVEGQRQIEGIVVPNFWDQWGAGEFQSGLSQKHNMVTLDNGEKYAEMRDLISHQPTWSRF